MKLSKCMACGKTIVFLPTERGNLAPVDYDSLQVQDRRNVEENVKVYFNSERGHIIHFSTCTDPAAFRKSEKKQQNKFRIRNTETGSFLSVPLPYNKAKKDVEALNENAGRKKYEVVYNE